MDRHAQWATCVAYESVLNSDGTARVLASPVSGLTNAQTWDQYGIVIACDRAIPRELSPVTTQMGTDGLVNPI